MSLLVMLEIVAMLLGNPGIFVPAMAPLQLCSPLGSSPS